MSESYQPSPEFTDLLVAVTEGDLDVEQQSRLNQLICEDESARDYYVDYVSLHAMLELRHHPAPAVSLPLGPNTELVSKRDSNWLAWIGFAVAASLLIAVSYRLHQQYGPNHDVVATLIDGDRLQWENPEEQPTTGGLKPGRGRVPGGTGHLELNGGVRIVMRGPADFELLGEPNRFKFDRGVMRAVVPPGAEGFTVVARGHEIVDLGTEFGISIDKHNDIEVHVFQGSVRIGDKITLKADEGQGINHKGTFYKPRLRAGDYPSVR